MLRPARRFLGLVLALGVAAAASAAAALELAPGQAFDRRTADRLLGPPLAEAVGASKVQVFVERPSLPLGNPYPRVAAFDVTAVHTTADHGFVAAVAITVADRAPLELVLRGRFHRLIGIPVPIARIKAGAPLDAAAFETRWLPAGRVRGEWVTALDAIAGREAHRALLAGQPVSDDAIGARRLVRRGERVTLVFVDRGLRLEATGTARGDAGMDETVEVRNDRSGTVVTGRVRAAGRVHVEKR